MCAKHLDPFGIVQHLKVEVSVSTILEIYKEELVASHGCQLLKDKKKLSGLALGKKSPIGGGGGVEHPSPMVGLERCVCLW